MKIEAGKNYVDGNDSVWVDAQGKTSAMHKLFTLTRKSDGAVCTFKADGTYRPEERDRTAADACFDLVSECVAWFHEPGKVQAYDPNTETFGPLDVKTEIGNEAMRIVSGARRSAYGKPEQNFERISRFWQAYFLNTGRAVEITAADVSPMMRLMKEARLCETPDHRDSFVDLIGYTLTGAEVNGVSPK